MNQLQPKLKWFEALPVIICTVNPFADVLYSQETIDGVVEKVTVEDLRMMIRCLQGWQAHQGKQNEEESNFWAAIAKQDINYRALVVALFALTSFHKREDDMKSGKV